MPVKRQLMAEQWDEFARAVLKPNCPSDQRREMRRAFYAGAESILLRVIAAFAPEREPTDADLSILDGVHQELRDFAELIKEGRA